MGGQKTIRSYWRNYFEETDAVIWVVDSADKMRLEMCRDELQTILVQEKLAGATLLVFVNKQDIEGAYEAKEILDILELGEIGPRHWYICPCSAITGDGLLEGFNWVADDVKSRIFMKD